MKINFKNILIIDVIVIIGTIVLFLYGPKIVDLFYFTPEKTIYKNMLKEINPIINNEFSSQELNNQKITSVVQEFMTHSEALYGIKLDGTKESLSELDKIFAQYPAKHNYEGNMSLLTFYLGEIIKNNTESVWVYNDGQYLVSKTNNQKVDVNGYIIDKIMFQEGKSAQQFYDESVKILGGEK